MTKNKSTGYDLDAIVFKRCGEGESRALLLHGWGGNADSLVAIANPLRDHRQVWSIALPGFGGSPEPPEPWDTMDYAGLVNEWIVSRELGEVDVIAHSFGGRVAIALASRHPECVRSLSLIDASGLNMPRSLRTRFKILLARTLTRIGRLTGGKISEWLVRRKEWLGSTDWRTASPVMRGTMSRTISEDLAPELKRISAPTLLVYGSEDCDTPPELGRRMQALIPNSGFVLIPDAGHYCFLDKRGEVLSAIWRHLSLPSAW